MASKKRINVSFKKVENGFIIDQNITTYDADGNYLKDESRQFVSTTASGTKKLIGELTDEMKDDVGNDKNTAETPLTTP